MPKHPLAIKLQGKWEGLLKMTRFLIIILKIRDDLPGGRGKTWDGISLGFSKETYGAKRKSFAKWSWRVEGKCVVPSLDTNWLSPISTACNELMLRTALFYSEFSIAQSAHDSVLEPVLFDSRYSSSKKAKEALLLEMGELSLVPIWFWKPDFLWTGFVLLVAYPYLLLSLPYWGNKVGLLMGVKHEQYVQGYWKVASRLLSLA